MPHSSSAHLDPKAHFNSLESARDTVTDGKGDDVIRVFNRPTAKDVVNCGGGFDRVIADRRDVLAGCNWVMRSYNQRSHGRADVLQLQP